MQLESLLRATMGVKLFRVERITEKGKVLEAWLEPFKCSKPVCSSCGKKAVGYDLLQPRTWSYVPMWGFQVKLHYRPRRASCRKCGIKVEKIPWSMGKSTVSVHLAVYIAILGRMLSWKEVARLTSLSWNTVRAAIQAAVTHGLEHRDLSGVIYIGIDEISRRKGHTYQTNVYDLHGKRLLWTGQDREANTLERFFTEWGKERAAQLVAICCDMWDPYIKIIRLYAPQAILVFDKFHIVKHLTEAVDKVRIEEAREKKAQEPELLKGTRYIWLKNPENLTDKQKTRLSYLEKLNLKINRAYLLKEAFREFWSYSYPANAAKYLNKWCRWAMRSGLEPLKNFVRMIRAHKENILSYFKIPVSNAMVEGLNRVAKVLSQRAYGYRTASTFALALYLVLGDLPLPEVTHRFL